MDSQTETRESSYCTPIAASDYTGDLDENKLQTGVGTQKWHREYLQKYKGEFLQNSVHGKGTYSWEYDGKKTVYEGYLYANDLEGYGSFSYNDHGRFEGLFKNNRRFGPGIYTYPEGNQDVGLWYGKNLIRLCQTVNADWMPRIAKTPSAKIKLLRYKKLVPVCEKRKDRAKDILENLEASEEVIQKSDILYNIHIRNPNSLFFNTGLYDQRYFCEKDCYIEVAVSVEEEKELNLMDKSQNKSMSSSENLDQMQEMNGSVIKESGYCLCQTRHELEIQGVSLELDHTEEVLRRIRDEVEVTKRRKVRIEKKMLQETQNTTEEGSTAISLSVGAIENLSDVGEEEEIDYKTACNLLDAAISAENLLLTKRDQLVLKLNSLIVDENQTETDVEVCPKKMILVTDLLAWNNGAISVEMLKHAFLYRNFEKQMSYPVANLLSGDRSEFGKVGVYEEDCIAFLTQCSNGNFRSASDLFIKHDLNPNLCDAKGNTGLMYAVARDKIRMIKTLINFGANVDSFNDECFTPLSLCIVRYLAVQHKVIDWEKAFLKPVSINLDEEREVREWRPHVSLTTISSINLPTTEVALIDPSRLSKSSKTSQAMKLEGLSELFGSNLDFIHTNVVGSIGDIYQKLQTIKGSCYDFQEKYTVKDREGIVQPFLFNTDCIKPPQEKKGKDKKNKKGKGPKPPKSSKSGKNSKGSKSTKGSKNDVSESPMILFEPEKFQLKPEDILLNHKLNAINETISTLLKYGADPNIGEVPAPTLIMAVFTKKPRLFENILIHKADPNVTTLDENLTVVHVLVSLSPCEEYVDILQMLLKYTASQVNLNSKTNINHWYEQKKELLANHVLVGQDDGKTPLHILCMRYDFITDPENYLNEMASILVKNGASMEDYYLGHTPLSLAIIRGNVNLVKTLLGTYKLNPNQLLEENMGVPLTLFILKRNDTILPVAVCQELVNLLLDYKGNPFNSTGEWGNAIEFMHKEHEVIVSEGAKGKKGKPGKAERKKTKGKKSKKKLETTIPQNKEFLMKAAKTVLEKHIKGWAVKYLYFFVELEDYYDNVTENMAQMLTTEETLTLVQNLVHRGEIPVDELIYEKVYDLIEFIINATNVWEEEKPPSSTADIDKILENFDFKKIPRERGKLNLPSPEVEKYSEKYYVCFNCYKRRDRLLFLCPKCNLIYFCSEECNRQNNYQKNAIHKCGLLFYNLQKEKYAADPAKQSLNMKRLPQLEKERGWTQKMYDEDTVARQNIPPDPTRRLHLTAKLRLQRRMLAEKEALKKAGGDKLSTEGRGFKQRRYLRSVSSEERKQRKKGKVLKIGKYKGIEFKGDLKDGERLGGRKGKMGKRERQEKTHGKHGEKRTLLEEKDGKLSMGKGHKVSRGKGSGKKGEALESDSEGGRKKRKGKKGLDVEGRTKGKQKETDTDNYTDRGKDTEGKSGGLNAKGKSGRLDAKGKSVGAKRNDGKADGGRGDAVKSKIGGSESPRKGVGGTTLGGRHTSVDKLKQLPESLKPVRSKLMGDDEKYCLEADLGRGFMPMPMGGGRMMEFRRRLPNKYQYFLERIGELWPDFDLSMLFLPYACFSDGQLYYRFLTNRPLFMETYSNV